MKTQSTFFLRLYLITSVLFCSLILWQLGPCAAIKYRQYGMRDTITGYAVRRMKTYIMNMTEDLVRDSYKKKISVWHFRRPYQTEYNCTLEFNAGDLVFTLRTRYAKMWKLYTRAYTRGDQLRAAEVVKYLDKVNAWGQEITQLADMFKANPGSLKRTLPPTNATASEGGGLRRGKEWQRAWERYGRTTPSLRASSKRLPELATRANNPYVARKRRRQWDDGGFNSD